MTQNCKQGILLNFMTSSRALHLRTHVKYVLNQLLHISPCIYACFTHAQFFGGICQLLWGERPFFDLWFVSCGPHLILRNKRTWQRAPVSQCLQQLVSFSTFYHHPITNHLGLNSGICDSLILFHCITHASKLLNLIIIMTSVLNTLNAKGFPVSNNVASAL